MAYADNDSGGEAPKPKGIDETQLAAIIAQQIELAKHHDKHEREADRAKAIDYYLGNMDKYVPPEENRSRVVSRDVADTVGWQLPDIMRTFTASDKMAVAEPVGMEDIEFAREATEGLNYVFWKDNRGYEVVYTATWDALVTKKGIVKTFYDDTPVYATSFHSGLSEDQRALLLEPGEDGEEPEVLAQTENVASVMDPTTMQPVEVKTYDLKIKRKKADGTFIVDAIPPEEFLIDGDAIFTDEAAFTDHWQRKTRSELVGMGYDKDLVASIPEAARVETEEEQARRLAVTFESTDTSMQLVDYHECFIRIDVDDDGEAELIRACYAGDKNGKLLDWEVWEDENPFDDIPCEPIPHRWDARSTADETIDIQDIKTVLSRQMLNNTYWVNNPQRFVSGKVKNPDALDNPVFGQTVFGDAGTQITGLPVPYIGDKALLALQHFDEVRTARTGVGRQSMALDPDILQNQTATASNNQRDAQRSQTELIARNMAEWGWKKVFRKLLRLMIKHQTHPRKLMLNNREVTIDPRHWNADMDVTINVGLGTGSRDRDMSMLGQVLQTQLMLADRFMASGATEDAIDLLPKIITTMTKMAESAGIRNPEDYYPEYTEEKVAKLKEMAAQQPDPALALEQAKGEIQKELKAVDAQVTMQVEQGKLEGHLRESQLDSEVQVRREQAQLEADMMTKEADRQNALALERVKQQGAIQLEQMRIESAERMKAAELAQQRELEQARMANALTTAAMKPKPQPGKGADA